MSIPSEVSSRCELPRQNLRVRRRFAFLLFLFFNFVYLLTSTGRVRTSDEYMTLFQTESLVLQHSTAVPQAVKADNFYGKYDLHLQPRAPYSPGQPLAATPWYTLGRYLFLHLPGVPSDASDLILGFAVCLSSATFSAAAVSFSFLVFSAMGINLRTSLFSAAIIGFATPVFSYSAWFFSEPLTTALLLAAAYFAFARNFGSLTSTRFAAMSGLLLGAAVVVRPTQIFAVFVFVIAVLVRDRRQGIKPALVLGATAAIGIGSLLLYNMILFGNPFDFGYPAVAEAGKRLNSFETPIFTGLFGLLLSPGKSVFIFVPPTILALFGVGRLWRLDRGLAVVCAATLPVYLLFYARYSQWEGGYCFGPRYMVPALALLCIALGPMLAECTRRVRVAAISLMTLGAFVQLIGIATSFMESQVPKGSYYDEWFNYRLSYSLWNQVELLIKYLRDSRPAALGLGFDRWFVFLSKAGVSTTTLSVMAVAMVLGLGITGFILYRSVRSADVKLSSQSSPACSSSTTSEAL